MDDGGSPRGASSSSSSPAAADGGGGDDDDSGDAAVPVDSRADGGKPARALRLGLDGTGGGGGGDDSDGGDGGGAYGGGAFSSAYVGGGGGGGDAYSTPAFMAAARRPRMRFTHRQEEQLAAGRRATAWNFAAAFAPPTTRAGERPSTGAVERLRRLGTGSVATGEGAGEEA